MTEEAKKKKVRGRKLKIVLFVAIGIAVILSIARPVLNKIVESKVKENLEQLEPFAAVNFSSIHADLFASSISINDLSIKFKPDTSDIYHYHSFNFSKADFTGVSFLDMMLKKKLLINKLQLNKGTVELDQFLMDKKDLLRYDLMSRMPFKNISIIHFETDETNVWVHLNRGNKLLLKGKIYINDIDIDHLQQSSGKTFRFNSVECSITDVNYSIPSSNQILQIKRLLLNSKKGTLAVDSLKIISGSDSAAGQTIASISNM